MPMTPEQEKLVEDVACAIRILDTTDEFAMARAALTVALEAAATVADDESKRNESLAQSASYKSHYGAARGCKIVAVVIRELIPNDRP